MDPQLKQVKHLATTQGSSFSEGEILPIIKDVAWGLLEPAGVGLDQ